MKAMILAAGRGQRMMPLTKNTPKPLLKIKNKTLIEHSINSLRKAGIKDIVINISYLGKKIKSYLGNGSKFGVNIKYSDEKSSALETAGGIIKALPLLGTEPFIVINSDVFCDYKLSKLQLPINSLAHLVLVDSPEHNKNGDFFLDKQGLLMNQASQTNQMSRFTFSGIGIYHPELFKPYLNKDKLTLASVFKKTIKNKQLTGEYFPGYWQDVGTPGRLEFVNSTS